MSDSTRQDDKYIPINKGHFELDTPERSQAFSEKLAHGWEQEYAEYRRLWNELPRERVVRDYPLLLDLELSSVCNLNCPMCPTARTSHKEGIRHGLMDFDLFKRCIDETAGKVFAVRLSLVGEPTLHPRFIDAIRYAKEAGVREVSFLTNGSKLDLPFFREIAEAGADWITFSVDGTHEEYEAIRRPLTWEDTLKKLQDIKAYKDTQGLSKPVIKVQSIWPAIRKDPTAFYDTLAPLVDLLAYNPLIDYLHKDDEIVYEDNFFCPQVYQRLVVSSDGLVKLCSNDEDRQIILGDARKESIHGIWHGTEMNRMREIHNRPDGYLELAPCVHCYYPRKVETDERAMVGDREILIENYVGRKQTVGQ